MTTADVQMPIELTLRDGTPAIVWPLLPTDGHALQFGYDHLSPRSRRRRFLGPVDRLDDRMLSQLVDGVDGEHHIALVLVALPFDAAEQPVGVARLVQFADDESTAEIAFTVADEWHGRGVASALAAALLRLRPPAVQRLRTEVAADNRASIALLTKLGTSHVSFVHPGVLEVTVELETSRAPAAVGS